MQHDFILLDRSGSMSEKMDEAISSINAYVSKLSQDNVDTGVTLVAFDKTDKTNFEVVRDRITPLTWLPVTNQEVSARGITPLNDAIGRIVTLANNGNYDKVAFFIITDGLENASVELTHAQAKNQLDMCRSRGWQVLFLGADFDNQAQAASYGTAIAQTVGMASGNMVKAMTCTAIKRSAYANHGASMLYSDDERKTFSSKS